MSASDRFERYIQGKTAEPKPDPPTFEEELVILLNKHSKENYSGTPDWILMEFLRKCLEAWDLGVRLRADWRGESTELPALIPPEKGHRMVPLVVTSPNGRMMNDIGQAEIKITPGEMALPIGRIERVVAVFEEDPNESNLTGSAGFIAASDGQVEAGMKAGIASVEDDRPKFSDG